MTEKQKQILLAALHLFGEKGYAGTSTKSIAEKAGVSEGLIFRHFENKANLLDEIIAHGETHYHDMAMSIIGNKNPSTLLAAIIEVPLKLMNEPDELAYWHALTKLKYELGVPSEEKYKKVIKSISMALLAMGHSNAENIARAILAAQEACIMPAARGDEATVQKIVSGIKSLVFQK